MTRTRRTGPPALVLTGALLLAGCADQPGPPPVEIDRTPTSAVEAPAEVDPDGLRLPLQVDTVRIVDPGWDAVPQSADGITLGVGERDGLLRFTAVAADGEALWSADRPVSRTGYAVTTTPGGRALAVLTDSPAADESEAGVATSATAYDLSTGEQVWGPVDVPGPLVGPGLVFSAEPTEPMGTGDARVVLDAGTGQVLGQDDGATVLGEYRGTVVTRQGDDLVATDTAGAESWRLDAAAQGWDPEALVAATEPAPGPGVVRVRTDDASEALVDLADGTVLADGFTDVGVDPTTGTVITVDVDEVRGLDAEGAELWTSSSGQETAVEGVSGALVYLRVGDSLRAHNVVTGNVAEAYDPEGTGDLVVPVLVTEDGSIALSDYEHHYLATTDTTPPPAP
ncbi:hypothetical protein [Isoptericola sp. b408]|uniref:hypothetical protein n=1 Tax=Isoptericola sp. b408 TaxID=3064653 RepID=UPI00271399D4|nr:hypothetical protein [Isoptericola sp. b408]MDO8150989.1 hypothetical protein [Isoptericola sp. b408]